MKRIFEELLPFAFFYFRAKKIIAKAADPDIGNIDGEYGLYHQLDADSLAKRIKEEHDRASTIDDKTIKFTISLSIALTILGSIGGYFSKTLDDGTFKIVVSSTSSFSVLYTIIGGILALGALKTLPRYGYGTKYDIQSKNDDEVKIAALAAQEKINTARHLRNEAAYQCLRNGFIILMFSVVLFTVAPLLGDVSHENKIENAATSSQGSAKETKTPSDKPKRADVKKHRE